VNSLLVGTFSKQGATFTGGFDNIAVATGGERSVTNNTTELVSPDGGFFSFQPFAGGLPDEIAPPLPGNGFVPSQQPIVPSPPPSDTFKFTPATNLPTTGDTMLAGTMPASEVVSSPDPAPTPTETASDARSHGSQAGADKPSAVKPLDESLAAV
ncbi:MAG: hypothetical protein ACRDD1_20875, partial [Planctomycetia bacterium]